LSRPFPDERLVDQDNAFRGIRYPVMGKFSAHHLENSPIAIWGQESHDKSSGCLQLPAPFSEKTKTLISVVTL
jgi:hypothetical protein